MTAISSSSTTYETGVVFPAEKTNENMEATDSENANLANSLNEGITLVVSRQSIPSDDALLYLLFICWDK